MTTQGKIIFAGSLAAAILAMGGAFSLGSGMLVATLGKPPWASTEYLEVIAQYSLSEISARQIQIQMEIDRLKIKCQANNCSAYERQSLGNLMDQWQRNQATIENMRRYSVQRQYQYPSAAQR